MKFAVTTAWNAADNGMSCTERAKALPSSTSNNLHPARGSHQAGAVASPREAKLLRQTLPVAMLIVTPGAQLAGEAKSDQARTATPSQAMLAGATHLIVGRSITRASDPVVAFLAICSEVAEHCNR